MNARQLIGVLERVLKERNVSMGEEKGKRKSMSLLTLSYVLDMYVKCSKAVMNTLSGNSACEVIFVLHKICFLYWDLQCSYKKQVCDKIHFMSENVIFHVNTR